MTDQSNQFEFLSSSGISFEIFKENQLYLYLEDLDENSIVFLDRPSRFAKTQNSFELLAELSFENSLLKNKPAFGDRNIVVSFFDIDDKQQKVYVFELEDIIDISPDRNQIGLIVSQSSSQNSSNDIKNQIVLSDKLFGEDVSLFLGPSSNSPDSDKSASDMIMMSGLIQCYNKKGNNSGKIRLKNVPNQSLAITNEPYTNASHGSTSGLINKWHDIFEETDPNIILNLVNKETGEHQNQTMVMSNPEYDSNTQILDFEISLSPEQKEASEDNFFKYDPITGIELLDHENYFANLFIDNIDGIPWPDFVGDSAFQILNNTNNNLQVKWTNFGNDSGYKNDSLIFDVDSGTQSQYIYGETFKDWDVSMKVYDLVGNAPIYIGQFDAQRPNIGKAWLSLDKEMTKIYATKQDFTYTHTFKSDKQNYPITVEYTSKYYTKDPVSGGNIDSNINLWQITFHDFS